MKETANKRCLLITSYTEESKNLLKYIAKALKEIGVELIQIDEMRAAEPIHKAVQQLIERSDIIIFDLTDFKPNVLFEMGLAFALRKPILPIVQSSAKKIPSDLAGLLFLIYDPSRPQEIQEEIKIWIPRLLRESAKEAVG